MSSKKRIRVSKTFVLDKNKQKEINEHSFIKSRKEIKDMETLKKFFKNYRK